MAVDWIKMRVDLQTHPKVVRIMSALKADKFRVIGGLHAVWSVFDAHSEDGRLDGYSPETMDSIIGWPGFSAAMALVGWLAQDGETLVAPAFEEHNGRTAKRRATETQRKKDARKVSASNADEKRTREEKRREEVNQSPKPPAGAKAVAVEFKTFIAKCKAENEKPISDYKPLFAYTDRVSLPAEFVQLAWFEFGRIFGEGGVKESRRQKDWRKTFRNYVEKGYLKLWWLNGETFELTTAGKQAQRANAERLAA